MAKKSSLGTRFDLAPDTLKHHRLVASLEGLVGTGKNHFAFTARDPILNQSIDLGTEGVVEKFRKAGKEIYETEYEWSPGFSEDDDVAESEEKLQRLAKDIRAQWEKDYYDFVDGGGNTVIMDTESRIWQVFRYAEFGGPNSGNPKDYDALNMRYEKMINYAKARKINLFLIRSMKSKWGMVTSRAGRKSFGKTGGHEAWGYDHLPSAMMAELTFVQRNKKEIEAADDGNGEFVIKVGKCRHNADIAFTTVPRCSFPDFGTLLVPESTREDWGYDEAKDVDRRENEEDE